MGVVSLITQIGKICKNIAIVNKLFITYSEFSMGPNYHLNNNLGDS